MLVNGVAPVIAPALGGIILSVAVWRVIFVILTIFGILMVMGSLTKIPESLSLEYRDSSGIKVIFQNFKKLIRYTTICATHAHTRCFIYFII